MVSFLSIMAVGFFLGMRHATDPDHVIAVATIVTRQRSLTRAALTGAFWGLGHTLTIFVVGAAIILFDVVIPARIGLSMELSVGFMLIVLGVMNVAGFLRAVPSPAGLPTEETGPVHAHPNAHPNDHEDRTHNHVHGHSTASHSHKHGRTLALLD